MPSHLSVVPLEPLAAGQPDGEISYEAAAVALVESLVALQSVATREDLLAWADGHLRPQIGYRAIACLLAEPHRSGLVIRDVIASGHADRCLARVDGENLREPARVGKARDFDIVDASRAVLDHWLRDHCALQMGSSAGRARDEDARVAPLLACFDVDAVFVHGVREAFGGSATFLLVGVAIDDARDDDARHTLDTLTLVMPALHVARQRIHRTERAHAIPAPGLGLTARELAILTLLAEGRTDEEAAKAVGRSVHTVKNQVRHLVAKLGARNRTQAVFIAGRHDLLQADLPAAIDGDATPN